MYSSLTAVPSPEIPPPRLGVMIFQNGTGVARNEQSSRYRTAPERGANPIAPDVPLPHRLRPCHHLQARVTPARPRELVHYRGRKIILADEPVGNLDTQTSATIVELLCSLSRTEGTTVILVTHDASIADQADRVLRLEDGRLALST